MIWSLPLVAVLAAADPRPELVRLALDGRAGEALELVEAAVAADGKASGELGFDYLRGHLLEGLGRPRDAHEAFARAMALTPPLAAYARFRLAANQAARGHPEVAAGLLATLLAREPPPPLVTPATELLVMSLRQGGDCRLLAGLQRWRLPAEEARRLELSAIDCALAAGHRDEAGRRLLALLHDTTEDTAALGAAERLSTSLRQLVEAPEVAALVGRAFHQQRRFELSAEFLGRGIEARSGEESRLALEDPGDRYALARSFFWRGQYLMAASHFGRVAATAELPDERARSLYQQGRSYELMGNWGAASSSYRLAFLEDSEGRWADAALLSAMRVEWRLGNEAPALELYGVLGSKRKWRHLAARAALFLASSDVVRGRADRAGGWLEDAAPGARPGVEVPYWRGRLAELEGEPERAVEHYAELLVADAYHPLAQLARQRLAGDTLAAAAADVAARMARSDASEDLLAAWLLLAADEAESTAIRQRLLARLAATDAARRFLELDERPPTGWPLFAREAKEPEELLLALGIWAEGAPAVARHFPLTDPGLGYTGIRLLERGGALRQAVARAEVLGAAAARALPPALVPEKLARVVYPLPYALAIQSETGRFRVDPWLLTAILREESRFDRAAVSAAAARGLAQFTLPTAERLAPRVGLASVTPQDLENPLVAIALGAAYLAELSARFSGRVLTVVAAYNAGERQAELWQSYCYSRDPAEYFTKVGFPETRGYLERVLASHRRYSELYRSRPG